jgi:hypothetical protein
MKVNNIIPIFYISQRLLKHKREFHRYIKEVKQSEKGNRTIEKVKQKIYSSEKAGQELAIVDELDFILRVYSRPKTRR